MLRVLRQPGRVVALGLLAGALLLLWPMVQQGYPLTHSTHFNLSWAFQYQRQFLAGQLYPRWLEYSNFGFGNATFAFYPPLCMAATLPFRLLGLEMPASLVASMGLAMGGFGAGLYLLLRLLLPWPPALILALAGMAGPYWLADIYQRGAIGEVWAIVLLPWVFWASVQVLRQPGTIWPVGALAASYGLLALSHLPTLLLSTLIWLPLPWVLGRAEPLWPRVARCYLGFVLGLGWSAFYLFPAFWDQRFIQVDTVNFATEYLPQHRLMLTGLTRLQPQLTQHWFEGQLVEYWGWMVAVVVAVGLLLGLNWAVGRGTGKIGLFPGNRPAEEMLLYSLGASLVAMLMMTDVLGWVYEWVLPLRRIQFSWRWMGITAVTLPWLLGSLAGWGWGQLRLRLLLSLAVGAAVAVQVGQGLRILTQAHFQPDTIQTFQTLSAAKQFPHEPQERPGTPFLYWHWIFPDGLALVDVPEYRAHGVTFPMPPPQVEPLLRWQGEVLPPGQGQHSANPEPLLEVEAWRYGYRRFRAVNPTDREQRVALRTFYYPAWWVQVDGRFRAAEQTELGQLQVRIPPGSHRVEVRYLGTAADWAGRGLTALSGVLLVQLRRLLHLLGLRNTPREGTAKETSAC